MSTGARITLGTAQFGLDYGITNRVGQLAEDQALAVLEKARMLGVRWLDTAAAYGTAESVLGRLLGADRVFDICTKVLRSAGGHDPVELAQLQLTSSLVRLGRREVDMLMIHDAQLLLGQDAERVYSWLADQRDSGRTAAIGASVYEGSAARALCGRFQIDWVQLPLNVLDQRCLRDGTLEAMQAAGVRVQVRSALLQGLLLADPTRLPAALASAATPLNRVRSAAASGGWSALELSIGFVASVPGVDQIVLGVESPAQLSECVAALDTPVEPTWHTLASDDLDVIDPRRWPPGLRLAA